MQKFKEADGGLSDGTAIDRDGFNAGTKLLSKFVNDNMWNMFEVVERAGYTLIDGDTSQLAKAIRAPYNASYTYNTSAIDTQSVNDVVLGSDGYYYEAQEDGVKDVDPVTDDSGKWKRIGFAQLNGDKTQKFKVADAEEDDEALSKGQLLEAIKAVDGDGSGLDADLVQGKTPVALGTNEITKIDGSTIKNQCTAWVNFDGTDGTIRDSYNVASVTRTDEGYYEIAFSTEMSNVNYSVSGNSNKDDETYVSAYRQNTRVSKQAIDKVYVQTGHVNESSSGHDDYAFTSIHIFGGKN